jgi:hypothetical protein
MNKYKTLITLALALTCVSAEARPTWAALNRRFDIGRLGPNQLEYVWSLELVQLIRPELRGTTAETAHLAIRCLRDSSSGDLEAREWVVLNRRGYPVRPRPEFLLPTVNFITKGTPAEYTPTFEQFGDFDRLRVYVQSGVWLVETRLAEFDSVWQPVDTLSPGDVGAYLYEHDFHEREYRLVRQ